MSKKRAHFSMMEQNIPQDAEEKDTGVKENSHHQHHQSFEKNYQQHYPSFSRMKSLAEGDGGKNHQNVYSIISPVLTPSHEGLFSNNVSSLDSNLISQKRQSSHFQHRENYTDGHCIHNKDGNNDCKSNILPSASFLISSLKHHEDNNNNNNNNERYHQQNFSAQHSDLPPPPPFHTHTSQSLPPYHLYNEQKMRITKDISTNPIKGDSSESSNSVTSGDVDDANVDAGGGVGAGGGGSSSSSSHENYSSFHQYEQYQQQRVPKSLTPTFSSHSHPASASSSSYHVTSPYNSSHYQQTSQKYQHQLPPISPSLLSSPSVSSSSSMDFSRPTKSLQKKEYKSYPYYQQDSVQQQQHLQQQQQHQHLQFQQQHHHHQFHRHEYNQQQQHYYHHDQDKHQENLTKVHHNGKKDDVKTDEICRLCRIQIFNPKTEDKENYFNFFNKRTYCTGCGATFHHHCIKVIYLSKVNKQNIAPGRVEECPACVSPELSGNTIEVKLETQFNEKSNQVENLILEFKKKQTSTLSTTKNSHTYHHHQQYHYHDKNIEFINHGVGDKTATMSQNYAVQNNEKKDHVDGYQQMVITSSPSSSSSSPSPSSSSSSSSLLPSPVPAPPPPAPPPETPASTNEQGESVECCIQ